MSAAQGNTAIGVATPVEQDVDGLTVFARASSGRTSSFKIGRGIDHDFFEAKNSELIKAGFAESELDGVIVSTQPFVPVPSRKQPMLTRSANVLSIASSDTSRYPDVPKPSSLNDFPPQKSSSVLVSSNDENVCVYFWGDKGEDRGIYIPVNNAIVGSPNPPFPSPSKLAYRRYWQNTGSYRISGPQTFTKAITTTQGMSRTKSTTLSAELGVAWEGLSAKLSASTTSSITVEEEKSVTETYTFTVEAGKTVVYTLWQLVEEFVLTDSNLNPISWRGSLRGMGGMVNWPAKFKDHTFTSNTARYVSDPVIF